MVEVFAARTAASGSASPTAYEHIWGSNVRAVVTSTFTSTTTKATTNINLSGPLHHSPESMSTASSSPYRASASPPREDRLSEGGISPGSTSSGVSSSSMSPPNSAEKRKREDDEDAIVSSKRFLSQDIHSDLSPGSKYSKSPSPPSNIEENGSAFHKVTKSSSPPSQVAPQLPTVFHHPYAMAAGLMRSPLTGYPQPSPSPLHSAATTGAVFKENIPVSLADITRLANGLPVRARIPGMDAITASGKIPFHPDWRFHFPYYKSQNPIVENILQSATQPGQNTTTCRVVHSLLLSCRTGVQSVQPPSAWLRIWCITWGHTTRANLSVRE